MGAISLRRRRDPRSGEDVYEVKLDDDYLMSSQFIVAEVELARLALADLAGDQLEVVVGGLGLGYTARTVLEDARVSRLVVIERLEAVIDWHERGLVPVGSQLTMDVRCRLVQGDFFAMAGSAAGLDPQRPERRFHAIIVDIDHSPRHLLHPTHAGFYDVEGLRRLSDHLHLGGIFSLWSNDAPDDAYAAKLATVFTEVRVEVISFPNPLQDREATNTVYLARSPTT